MPVTKTCSGLAETQQRPKLPHSTHMLNSALGACLYIVTTKQMKLSLTTISVLQNSIYYIQDSERKHVVA